MVEEFIRRFQQSRQESPSLGRLQNPLLLRRTRTGYGVYHASILLETLVVWRKQDRVLAPDELVRHVEMRTVAVSAAPFFEEVDRVIKPIEYDELASGYSKVDDRPWLALSGVVGREDLYAPYTLPTAA